MPTPRQLNEFWEQCRTWLADQGVQLYELRAPEGAGPRSRLPKLWRTPVIHATPAQLPFAVSEYIANPTAEEYDTMVHCFEAVLSKPGLNLPRRIDLLPLGTASDETSCSSLSTRIVLNIRSLKIWSHVQPSRIRPLFHAFCLRRAS